MITRLLIACILFPCAVSAEGFDSSVELKFIIRNNPISGIQPVEETAALPLQSSETKLVGLGLISLYQKIVSSQQTKAGLCTFTPSCSQFGQSAVQQCGLFRGSLLAADRLLRCHPYNSGYYQVDPESNKLLDPLESYRSK